MLPESISSLVNDDIIQIDQHLKSLLKVDNPLLSQVGNYICESGGKRIRPMLLLLSAQLAGYRDPKHRLIHLASIIEFIHAATLLHDDVIDNSHIRRGNPSANQKWGNQLPILVGDYLYAKSFFLLVKDKNNAVMETVSDATAVVTDGEILQLKKNRDFSISEKEYIEIIAKKTASLMAASCKIGAILADISEEQIQALNNYGMEIGIAFQLVDDMLDYISHEQRLGKPVYNDLKEGNCTLPLIRGLQLAEPEELAMMHGILSREEYSDEGLLQIKKVISKYQTDKYTLEQAAWYVACAKQRLDPFPPSVYRQALLDLADYIVNRDF